jgi:ribonuclease BN (tRNA processing enzyme)
MKLEFLGVGEAFDPLLSNCTYLLHGTTKLLIDCGYAAPQRILTPNFDADYLDAIYLTHFHADHSFGLPALLVRSLQEERSRPLSIIGQSGTEAFVNNLLELAYPGIGEKVLPFLNFIESDSQVIINELTLDFAESDHSLRNLSLRISDGKSQIGISGDGALTEATRELYRPCSLLVHEAFKLQEQFQGHESAKGVAAYAATLDDLKTLAYVHICRNQRREIGQSFLDLSSTAKCQVILPEPGDIWDNATN